MPEASYAQPKERSPIWVKEKTRQGFITKPNIITACAYARARVGIVSVASGCSSLTPSDKTQTKGVYVFGIPGIAVMAQSH